MLPEHLPVMSRPYTERRRTTQASELTVKNVTNVKFVTFVIFVIYVELEIKIVNFSSNEHRYSCHLDIKVPHL